MDLQQEEIALIEKYVDQTLQPEEIASLEQRMQNDPAFKEAVEIQINTVKAIRFQAATDLKDHLRTLDSKPENSTPRWRYFVAASVSLISIVAFILYMQSGPSDSELYAQFYTPYPNIEQPGTRSGTVLDSALYLYEIQNYNAAIEQLKLSDNEASYFYLAQSYIALEQFESSIESLENLASKQSKYSNPAKWYLALVHLKLGDRSKATEYLIALQKTSDYQEKASNLLEEF